MTTPKVKEALEVGLDMKNQVVVLEVTKGRPAVAGRPTGRRGLTLTKDEARVLGTTLLGLADNLEDLNNVPKCAEGD